MFRRTLSVAVLALAALAFCSREASAQWGGVGGYGVSYGDMVSPYLNLLSQNSSAGFGAYQNLVQTFENDRNFNQRLQGNINQLQNQVNGGGVGRGSRTSYGRHYMNYSHYYLGIRH